MAETKTVENTAPLRLVVKDGRRTLARLVSSPELAGRRVEPLDADRLCTLSRFACVRRLGSDIIIESPVSAARIALDEPQLAGWILQFVSPRSGRAMAAAQTEHSLESMLQLVHLLAWAQVLVAIDERGITNEDHESSLQGWEFQDLLFHAHTRPARYEDPFGATYPLAALRPAPPAVKAVDHRHSITLFRPNLDELAQTDPPLVEAMEQRTSIRHYGPQPLAIDQLGEFLFRVARVKQVHSQTPIHTPYGTRTMDFTQRPYPSGGCLYPLELYVAVADCDGCSPGLYHYDAAEHRLITLSALTDPVERLFAGATFAAGIPRGTLQVLLIASARFERVSWKYSGLAYSLILKEVGVLLQNMYLAATAMQLSPCALGAGDSDAFAEAIASDYFTETSVGEFALGSLPDASQISVSNPV